MSSLRRTSCRWARRPTGIIATTWCSFLSKGLVGPRIANDSSLVLDLAWEAVFTDVVLEIFWLRRGERIFLGWRHRIPRWRGNAREISAATWLMQAGVEKWEAAGFLGMSVQMLDRVYGHHHHDYLRSAARAIGYRPHQS